MGWIAAILVLEVVVFAGVVLQANQGGWLVVAQNVVQVHVRAFRASVAAAATLGELVVEVWARLDPLYRGGQAVVSVLPWISADKERSASKCVPRAADVGGLGGVIAVQSRLGEWAGRLFTALAGLAVGILVGGVVAVMSGHRGQALPMLIAGGVFGLVFACAALASDAAGSHDGMATGRDLRRSMYAGQVRRSARITRPGLERPKKGRADQYGIALVRKGQAGRWLYASLRDVILIVAPPQTGKTALMGNTVIDAPGAVVATSTKPDIFEHTAAVRPGPLYVLNPEGLAGIPTNFRWSPIEGCERPSVAIERAGYLLAGAPSSGDLSDRNFWDGMNARLLRNLLYAAAVGGRNMEALCAWISDPGDDTPLRIMRHQVSTPAGWELDLEQIRQAPPKTRDSAYLTLAQAFQWMADPDMAAAACPEAGEPTFNIERFLAEEGTLYLLGSERPHGSLGPLFTALTGHIHERAKNLASKQRHGRLDPPLTMVLDEAALICKVPLERWTADSGGRGIVLTISVQSPSQLYDGWGQRGGETIWNNSNIKLIFGGLGVAKDLEDLSVICGDRLERSRSQTYNGDSKRSTTVSERSVRVLPPNVIRQLPDGQALVLRRNTPPVIGRIRPVWDRSDVRRARKAGIDPIERLGTPVGTWEPVAEVIPLHGTRDGESTGSDEVASATS